MLLFQGHAHICHEIHEQDAFDLLSDQMVGLLTKTSLAQAKQHNHFADEEPLTSKGWSYSFPEPHMLPRKQF